VARDSPQNPSRSKTKSPVRSTVEPSQSRILRAGEPRHISVSKGGCGISRNWGRETEAPHSFGGFLGGTSGEGLSPQSEVSAPPPGHRPGAGIATTWPRS
jgi:hypothetical protein